MNLRSWLIVVGIVAMSILNGFLISNEHIERTVERDVVVDYEDRLGDLIYMESERENNFRKFGFDEGDLKKIRGEFKRLKRSTDQFAARLKEAEDVVLMTEVFCPRDVKSVRPRYAAARILIKESGGRRVVIDPKKDIEFVEQDWTLPLSLLDIYENIEKTKEELPYSSTMTISALLTKNEEALQRRSEPWGYLLDNSWNWPEVQEEFPRIKEELIKYFVLMHLVTEIANSENGLCQ